MQKLLLLISVYVLLASCNSATIYQISRVKSNNVTIAKKQFVYKDSTLILKYDLWEKGGIMNFQIYNRTDSPVYIDWNRSNFICNDKSMDYWQDVTTTNTNGVNANNTSRIWYVALNPLRNDAVTTGAYSSISICQKDKPNNQIPPKAYLSVNRFYVGSPFWTLQNYPKANDSIIFNYSMDSSIWRFRNYIAYTKNQDLTNLKFIDNSFWVSKLIFINNDRYNGIAYSADDTFSKVNKVSNAFYTTNNVSENNNNNLGAALVILLAIVVLVGGAFLLFHI